MKKGIRLICVVAFAAMTMFIISPSPAQAASDPGTGTFIHIPVEQIFYNNSSIQPDDLFTYILEPVTPGSPMPAQVSKTGRTDPDSFTFELTGNATIDIGPIVFDRPGVYTYELYHVIDTAQPGYTYHQHDYEIVVYVNSRLETGVVIQNIINESAPERSKMAAISFVHAFADLPSDPNLTVDPPVRKIVTGNPSVNSTFLFQLTAQDPSYPMPAGSINGVKTLTIIGSGEKDFGTWSYISEGVYRYTVSEVNTHIKGYTYDTTVYTITDTVKDTDGQLTVSRVVTNDANKPVTSLAFVNKYSASDGPKMGDEGILTFAIMVFAIGIVLVIGATVYLIVTKKRKKTR